MESKYFILTKESGVPLFTLEYDHKNEGPAVIDFQIKMASKRDLKAEDTIRDLYAKFRKRYDHVSDPIDLLGILLANGHSLQIQKDADTFDLYKDYFPISFEARSLSKTIRLGDYYRTTTTSVDEQFIQFSNWIDQLSGLVGMSHHMACQCLLAGFSIVACEPDKETILVEVDHQGTILGGQEAALNYLLNMGV